MWLRLIPRWLRTRLARIRAVARVEMLHLLRDRLTFSLVIAVPAVQIVLFGYAVNLDPKDIPVVIARQHADGADRLHRAIESTGYFAILADGLKPGAATRMVTDGKALVAIELSQANRTDDPNAPASEPRVIVDATDPATVRPALGALETAYWRHVAERATSGYPPSVDVQCLYNPEGRTAWAIAPGLAGVIVMISMLLLGALTLVRERERGSWEMLLATPVDAADALVGKLTPYVVIGVGQALAVILIGSALFDVPFAGPVWPLVLAMPVYAGAHLTLGFAFSAAAESQLQALQGAVFFYLPSMILSGFMFPFQGMPHWAQTIGNTLPLTHFVRATRGVLLKGEGAWSVAVEMAPVAAFAIVAACLALLLYRRRID